MAENAERVIDDEVATLLIRVRARYGLDFTNYAHASMRRRVLAFMYSERVAEIADLQEKVLADPLLFQRFVHNISVNVTSMFRDPSFHLALRKVVVPMIATYPFIRIWHAGCSTGEEVYSMAIMLLEEGLYDRVRIYATDVDVVAVERAKLGIYPLANMKEYSANYLLAGGKESLSKYYSADHENALFRNYLRDNITFAQHNLAGESTFNEFHVVLCRNVLIYFNEVLRERVLALLDDSLVTFGILALGAKESLRFSQVFDQYKQLVDNEKIYKKVI
jgi:chemotaxis protein methyltransferase CheR